MALRTLCSLASATSSTKRNFCPNYAGCLVGATGFFVYLSLVVFGDFVK